MVQQDKIQNYQINIKIVDDDYSNELIVALVMQGYSVHYNSQDKEVCFNITKDEIHNINN